MNRFRTMLFSTVLIGLSTLATLEARPAAAQVLTYTLSGVTFSDGATASGFFTIDPSLIGQTTDLNIVTTNGLTDTLQGNTYTLSNSFGGPNGVGYFFFASRASNNNLVLKTLSPPTSPGTFSLTPGAVTFMPYTFSGSGEDDPTTRTITGGSLIVTNANPVPEASTTVSFGLLLALGLGGGVIAARKKKAVCVEV